VRWCAPHCANALPAYFAKTWGGASRASRLPPTASCAQTCTVVTWPPGQLAFLALQVRADGSIRSSTAGTHWFRHRSCPCRPGRRETWGAASRAPRAPTTRSRKISDRVDKLRRVVERRRGLTEERSVSMKPASLGSRAMEPFVDNELKALRTKQRAALWCAASRLKNEIASLPELAVDDDCRVVIERYLRAEAEPLVAAHDSLLGALGIQRRSRVGSAAITEATDRWSPKETGLSSVWFSELAERMREEARDSAAPPITEDQRVDLLRMATLLPWADALAGDVGDAPADNEAQAYLY
jgi:hypothetical protein